MSSFPSRRTHVDLGHPATFEDLMGLPESVVGEIVNGELITSPRPGMPHTRAASDLGVLLGGPFRFAVGGPGGWIIFFGPYLRLGTEIRAPDLAGWRVERWMDQPRRGPIRLVPDWICEVLSPSTADEDRTTKRDLYARHGVRRLWLIDPDARTLEVHRLDPNGWLLVSSHANDARVRAEPFDAVELDLSVLWVPEGPSDEE